MLGEIFRYFLLWKWMIQNVRLFENITIFLRKLSAGCSQENSLFETLKAESVRSYMESKSWDRPTPPLKVCLSPKWMTGTQEETSGWPTSVRTVGRAEKIQLDAGCTGAWVRGAGMMTNTEIKNKILLGQTLWFSSKIPYFKYVCFWHFRLDFSGFKELREARQQHFTVELFLHIESRLTNNFNVLLSINDCHGWYCFNDIHFG